jgi:Ca2+-binding EF-hand superfamily protein
VLTTQSFERVKRALIRATSLFSTNTDGVLDPAATLSRQQFSKVFTDGTKASDGEYFELGMAVYRALDSNFNNKVFVRDLFILCTLFTKVGSGMASDRIPWLLESLFLRRDAEGVILEYLSIEDLRQIVQACNRAFVSVKMVERGFDPGEENEVITIIRDLYMSEKGAETTDQISAAWFGKWAQSEIAAQLFAIRFQMTATEFRNSFDDQTLPELVMMIDQSAYARGGGNTDEDPNDLRDAILKAVTGRQAMGDLQFKTGMTPAALTRLKTEFAKRANDLGTLELQAFKEIMLEQFPNLKEDESVVEKLFKTYDQDNSGCIEFKEFVLGASKMVRGSLKDKIETLFQIFDADGSGSVTIKELTRFVKSGCGEIEEVYDKARAMVYNLHLETPGIVTANEFKALMTKEPCMVMWANSLAKSSSLQLITKALSEFCVILEREFACEALAQVTGKKNPERENEIMKKPLSEVEMNTALRKICSFSSIFGLWDDRINLAKSVDKKAPPAGLDSMFLERVTGSKPIQEVSQALSSRKIETFLENTVSQSEFPLFFSSAFDLAMPGQLRSAKMFQGAVKSLFLSLASSRSLDDGKSDDDELKIPTRYILTQLCLAVAQKPEDLAMVMYRQADIDGDGTLTIPEIQRWMISQHESASGGIDAAQRLITSLDVDGDGVITESEFRSGIIRNPALFDVFGYLLGSLDVPVGVSQQKQGGKRGGDALQRSLDNDPTSPSGGAGGSALSGTFSGATLFGIGINDDDAKKASKKPLTEVEKIARRRMKYNRECQKLRSEADEMSKKMTILALNFKDPLDLARRSMEIASQQEKLSLVVSKQMLKEIEKEQKNPSATMNRPGSARPNASRPSTAGATRPSTATGFRLR